MYVLNISDLSVYYKGWFTYPLVNIPLEKEINMSSMYFCAMQLLMLF